MSGDKSVIQMTRAAHDVEMHHVSDVVIANTTYFSDRALSQEEVAAAESGFSLGWLAATMHIIRRGNCTFERSE